MHAGGTVLLAAEDGAERPPVPGACAAAGSEIIRAAITSAPQTRVRRKKHFFCKISVPCRNALSGALWLHQSTTASGVIARKSSQTTELPSQPHKSALGVRSSCTSIGAKVGKRHKALSDPMVATYQT